MLRQTQMVTTQNSGQGGEQGLLSEHKAIRRKVLVVLKTNVKNRKTGTKGQQAKEKRRLDNEAPLVCGKGESNPHTLTGVRP